MDPNTHEHDPAGKEPSGIQDNLLRLNQKQLYLAAVKLVATGVLLYVCLSHFDVILNAVRAVFKLLSPLLIGGLIALVLNTPMSAIDRLLTWIAGKLKFRKVNRKALQIIALILTFAIAVLLVYVIADTVIPQLVDSIRSIVQKSQQQLPKLMELLDKLEAYGINTASVEAWLAEIDVNALVQKITDNVGSLTDNVGSLVSTVFSYSSSIISGTFTALTAIVFAVYILANKKELSVQIKKVSYAFLKKSFVDRAVEIGSLAVRTFSNFISGQCLDACLLGFLCFFTMTIFGFPYALAISSLITVTAVIPYVGAFLGGAFGFMLMVIDDPIKALLFLVLFIVDQQLDNHLLYPRVVGGSVGLPAIWTFAAVIIGGSLWGVLGMILFIPLFSVFYTLIRQTVRRRLDLRGIRIEGDSDFEEDSAAPDNAHEPFSRKHAADAFGKARAALRRLLNRDKPDSQDPTDSSDSPNPPEN